MCCKAAISVSSRTGYAASSGPFRRTSRPSAPPEAPSISRGKEVVSTLRDGATPVCQASAWATGTIKTVRRAGANEAVSVPRLHVGEAI